MKKETVLITGASKGIGKELAEIFAKNGFNIVLVARSAGLLNEIKNDLEQKHGAACFVVPSDLTAEGAAQRLFAQVTEQNIEVDILVNNAGFGDHSPFLESDISRQINMIDLNVKVLTELCHIFGNEMKKRQHGRILNVASVAAVCPGPNMAVYYATKAFVLSFSEALAEELRKTGVSVTALCPGPVATEFLDVAGIDFKWMKPVKASKIAKAGYKAVMRRKTIKFPGFFTKFTNFSTRIFPRAMIRRTTKFINGPGIKREEIK